MPHRHAIQLEQEEARLRALHALDLSVGNSARELEELAALAAQLLDCPMSMVTLIDRAQQRIVASVGAGKGEVDRNIAFCNHTIRTPALTVVPDATAESRFADNPYVTGDMHVRFYAGMPISAPDPHTGDSHRVGAICAVDTVPRSISSAQEDAMRSLAKLAESILTARMISGQSLDLADLTQRQSQALQHSITTFGQAERIASIGSWQLGLPDGPLSWSDGMYRIHELPVGTPVSLADGLGFYTEAARAMVEESLRASTETGKPFDFEADLRTAAGRLRRVRCLGEPVVEDGPATSLSGVFQDITDRYALEQSLRRLAERDELTGLANRAAFNRTLEASVAAATDGTTPLLLLLADLDHFKPINDGYGHNAGDEVLQTIGARFQEICGSTCTPARLGGDEFAMIVRDPVICADPEPFVASLLDRLKQPAVTRYGTFPTSLTIGFGLFDPARDVTLREFVHRIDSALYDAKRDQRGTARRFAPRGRRSTDVEAATTGAG